MQYQAKNPAEYIEQLPNDWKKEKLLMIRNIILNHRSDIQEGMEYKMLCYGNGVKNIFHLNAQKNYVSLYVGNINKVPDARDLLRDFDLGKGCIRIRKKTVIAETGLSHFIRKTLQLWQQGGQTDC